MRKTVETHPELGHARLVMRADIMAIVCKYYRNNYRQDFNNWQTSFFVEGEKEPQLVAHAYARDTKKPGDLWYFKILLPEGAQTREQELLASKKLPSPVEAPKPEPVIKKPSGFRLKLNLRVERLRAMQNSTSK